MRILITTLLFILYPLILSSQTIEITVFDEETNRAVEFANVMWKQLDEAHFEAGSFTNRHGIARVESGNSLPIAIKVSFVGYETFSDTVAAGLRRYTVRLRPELTQLEGVVVLGKSKTRILRESSEAVSVIEMSALQGRSVSLESLLNKTIGLKIGQSGGMGSSSRIIIHGLEGNRIQILWDGIPISSSDGMFSLDEVPIDIIERIEIYKSIIPARFGCDGLGGAINIVTKEYTTDYLDASYQLGSYHTHKGSFFSRKNFPASGILLGAGGYYTGAKNNYLFRVPERENLLVRRDHDRFRSYMLKGKIAFLGWWFDEFSAEFGYYRRFQEIQGVMRNIQQAENSSHMLMFENRVIKSGLLDGRLHLESHLSMSQSKNHFIDTAHVNYDFEGHHYPSPNGRGETGVVPHHSDDRYLEANERLNIDFQLSNNHHLNLNTLINDAHKQPKDELASRHAGFVIGGYPSRKTSVVSGVTWEGKFFGEKLSHMLSAKYFYLHSRIEDLTSYEMMAPPQLKMNSSSQLGWLESVKYELFPGVHLKSSYQRAIRLPNAQELFGDGIITFPSAGLRPEKSHNFNGGFLFDRSGFLGLSRMQLEVNGFYMQVSDMIKLIKQHMAAGYVNAEKVRIKGVETELKIDFTPTIYAYGNLTYQDVRDQLQYLPGSVAPNPTAGMRLPNIPFLFANFGAEYHSDKLCRDWYVKAFWDGQFTEEFFYFWELTNLQKRRIPRSFTNDLGLLLTYKNRYSMAFECHNIADKEVWDQYRRPLPGRTFHIKFRYTFSKDIY